jgi:threonine dehydrogenase-like Zn-dependent dehydrogenase/predicted NBD/HSP70 family sugar kinase
MSRHDIGKLRLDRFLVVDIGGTTTRVGVYESPGELKDVTRFPSPNAITGMSVDHIMERHLDIVARSVDTMRARCDTSSDIGVAIGATISHSGIVRNASMVWRRPHTGFDVRAALAKRLPWARITIMNDVSAAAWRYRQLGRFALITISTGVAVKVFDDALPASQKLLIDNEGFGGEIGHVVVAPSIYDHKISELCSLGRGAADGEQDAGTTLERGGLPWCECGMVADLCSYTSGPAVARNATAYAKAHPDQWAGSGLARLCNSRPDEISTYALAEAARQGDAFTNVIMRLSTQHLAIYIAQISAELGLQTVVMTGGFAHAVGTPWFDALHENLMRLPRCAGWFTGWTGADVEKLIYRPEEPHDDGLLGMGVYLEECRRQIRELCKPVGEATTAIRVHSRPKVGREQFAARIAFAGICSTDLQILRGERGCEPGVLGHECVAEVVEIGNDVNEVRIGDVICLNPNHPRDEHEKIGHNQPGVFRELAVWDKHLAGRGQVIPLPSEGRAEWVLLEPLACAVRAMRVIGGQWEGRHVLIVGAGKTGLMHLMLARRWNAQVLLANRSSRRLHEAITRNFLEPREAVMLDGNLTAAVRKATDGDGVDAVIVTVAGGAGPSVVEELWGCLSNNATIHLFGGFAADARIETPNEGLIDVMPIRGQARKCSVKLSPGKECVLTGTRGALREDFEMARDMCVTPQRSNFALAPLITHVVSLEAMPAVISEMARSGTINGEYVLSAIVDLGLPGTVIYKPRPDELPRAVDMR